MQVIAGQAEEYWGALLVKIVSLDGKLERHWFDIVDTAEIVYTGYAKLAEDPQTGELMRYAIEHTETPPQYVDNYAQKKGYKVVEA